MSQKRPEAILKRLVFHCPKLRRQVYVKLDQASFRTSTSECDLCGGHGQMYVEFTCKCGSSHEVQLKDW